jgi:branched-chain amino acid transport system substrate-binding protein
MDTGAVAFPDASKAAMAAQDYINKELGGINGRPLQLKTCDMKNDEQASQACGQQFANEQDMPAALLTLAVNAGPYYSALNAASKPILGGYGIAPADDAPKDAFFYYSGANFYYTLADWIQQQGDIKQIAYFHGPDPASQGGADTLKKQLPADIKVNEQIIAPGTADLTPQVAAADTANADLVIGFAMPCGPLAQAFSDLGIQPKQVLSLTSCVNVEELKQKPELYKGWIIANPSKIPSADPSDPDSKQLLASWDKYAGGGPIGAFGEVGWGTVMNLYNVLKPLPADGLDSASILAAIKGFKGPVVVGSDTIACPGQDPTPATCANGLIFYDVTESGDLKLRSS